MARPEGFEPPLGSSDSISNEIIYTGLFLRGLSLFDIEFYFYCGKNCGKTTDQIFCHIFLQCSLFKDFRRYMDIIGIYE